MWRRIKCSRLNCKGIRYKVVGGPICELSRRRNRKHKKVKISGSLSLLNFDVDVTNFLSTNISLFKIYKLEILYKIWLTAAMRPILFILHENQRPFNTVGRTDLFHTACPATKLKGCTFCAVSGQLFNILADLSCSYLCANVIILNKYGN
jgi:hypothetical protein